MKFNPEKFEIQEIKVDEKSFKVRAYENIVYVKNPVDTQYQMINIYIPIEYFEGKTINGFSAETAPIFFPNKVGGYMPAEPAQIFQNSMRNRGGENRPQQEKSVVTALSKGFVVASAGARGRTSATGKAPAVIVDLKAAIKYLKFNDKIMVGDAEKIISNGTSAGGAMSALLGASSDSPLYEKYFQEMGVAKASDAIFAVSSYCPITNLENADMAYEWQFNKIPNYKKIDISMLDYNVQRKEVKSKLTENQHKASNELAKLFPNYLNSLKLKNKNGKLLTLNKKGNGNFKELIKNHIISSAKKAQNQGIDMGQYDFLIIENQQIKNLDWDKYMAYMWRQKLPPAFDGLDLSSGENQLFGDAKTDKKHFTKYSFKKSSVNGQIADSQIINLMNPMNFIGNKNAPKHWRIRHGSNDKDTSLAIAMILALSLENQGFEMDLAYPWDKPHSGDYDLEELFQWAESIAK